MLIYAYVGILSLFGLAVMCLLAISILTCQVNLCVLCHKKNARYSRDVVDRNGGRAIERRNPRMAHQSTEEQRRERRLENRQRESALGLLSKLFIIDEFNDHDECTICLEKFTDEDRVTPLPCDRRHYFHSQCIEPWFSRNDYCPLCKKTFTTQQLRAVAALG